MYRLVARPGARGPMKLASWWPVLLAPVAIVWASLAVREMNRTDLPRSHVASELVSGLVLVAAGLLVWWRRPTNRCWWLLVAAGFAWYVGAFGHLSNRDMTLASFVVGQWHTLFLALAVLVFPSGRLQTRLDRVLAVALVALFVCRALGRLLLYVPPDVAGYGTRNRFVPITDDHWWRLTEDWFAWGLAAVMFAMVAGFAYRWYRSSGPGRRMLSPGLFAATVMAVAVAYEYLIGWNSNVPGTNLQISLVALWAQAAVGASLAFGLLRIGRTRSAMIELVAELGPDAPPTGLGGALSRALADPNLLLLFWSPAIDGYVDGSGQQVPLPVDEPNRAVTLIESRGEPAAALVHDVALLEDAGLVNAVAAAVRLSIDNDRLQREIEEQLAEVAASRSRIVDAGEAERRRIERDLHDGAQQRLVAIAVGLRVAETRLDGDATPRVREVLAQAVRELGEAIDELRRLARGIHPTVLSESGLAAALESLLDRTAMPARLEASIPVEPPTAISAAAYFAVAEALTNVVKHAEAREVTVKAIETNGRLRITVEDDGRGGADSAGGTGLRGVGDRVAAVGGTMKVHSPRGGGTRFEVELPCVSS